MDRISDDRVRLTVDEARALALKALDKLGYTGDDGGIIVDHMLDAGLCGYEHSGLPKILDVAANPKLRREHRIVPPLALSAPERETILQTLNSASAMPIAPPTRSGRGSWMRACISARFVPFTGYWPPAPW